MTLTRRRFLSLTASAMVVPSGARAERWTGYMFGAEVSLDLYGARGRVAADLEDVVDLLTVLEKRFSIYDPTSELSSLNARGSRAISAEMADILQISRRVHGATRGYFDPTVQGLWQALSRGETNRPDVVGFERVRLSAGRAELGKGQALTLNGIAQGFATDRVRALLVARGYQQALVNIGEYAALGGPFQIGISDVAAGQIGTLSLNSTSVATSSPEAMRIAGQAHILSPKGGAPLWSTVSVEAESAALADACSTAFCLMTAPQIAQAKHVLGLSRVFLVDAGGNLSTL